MDRVMFFYTLGVFASGFVVAVFITRSAMLAAFEQQHDGNLEENGLRQWDPPGSALVNQSPSASRGVVFQDN